MNYEQRTTRYKTRATSHERHATKLPSTSVEDPLQISYFLCKTNPILSAVGGLQMNLKFCKQMDYENKHDWTLGENKPNSNPISKQLVGAGPRRAESAKMARKLTPTNHQNITLKNSNFLYPNRLNSLTQHNPPTGTSFAHLEFVR